MYYSKKEKSIMEPLGNIIEKNPNRKFKFIMKDNTEVIVSFDTCYDTDNNLDSEEDGYEEFFAYVFIIEKIISSNNHQEYISNGFLEITYHNFPKKIDIIN